MFSPAQIVTLVSFMLAPAFAQVEPNVEEVPASDFNVESLQAVIDGELVIGQGALQQLQQNGVNDTVPFNTTATPFFPNGTALFSNDTAPAANTTTVFTDEEPEEPILRRHRLMKRGDTVDSLYKQLRKKKDYKFCTQYMGYNKPRTIWHTKTSLKYKKANKYHTKTVWKTVKGKARTKHVTKTKYVPGKAQKKIHTVTDKKKKVTTKVYVTETITGLVDATSTAWPRSLHKRGGRAPYSLPAYLKKSKPKTISKACAKVASQRITFKTKTVYKTKVIGGKKYKTITKTKYIKPKTVKYKVHWTTIEKPVKPVYYKTITVPHPKASTVTKSATLTESVKICATRLPRVDSAGSNADGAQFKPVPAHDEGDCCGTCYKGKGCQGWFYLAEKSTCYLLKGIPGADKTDFCPAGTGSLAVFSRKGTEDDAAGPGQCGGSVRVVRW